MTFRDMTFCEGDGCARFNTCPRALTDSVKAAADRWWKGPGAPISQFMEPKSLECWASKEQVEGGEMTPDQIDTAIAEWIGWTEIHHVEESRRLYGLRPKSEDWKYRLEAVPQFHKCLNALQEAVSVLDYDQAELFVKMLDGIVLDDRKGIDENPVAYEFAITNATAPQRAESLLRTIGKWKEAE